MRHASDARHEGHLRASRRGVGARGEVGRRPGADRGARRAAADVQPQRQRHHRRLARAQHVAAGRPRPAGRRRDHRPQRARPPGLPDAAGPDAPAQRADRTPARRRPSPRRTWSSTCSASTARTSPGCPWEERRARLEGLGLDSTWQVPAVYDDGADALRRHPGSRGSRAWSASAARRRTPSTAAPTPGSSSRTGSTRRSWSAAGGRRRAPSAGNLAAVLVGEMTADGLLYRGRVGSGIGPKAGAHAGQAAGRPRPRRQPVRRRGAEGRRRSAPTGSSRSSSSTSTATRPPRTSGCASRRTAACAPT